MGRPLGAKILSPLVLVGVILTWQLALPLFQVPSFILPTPKNIFLALVENIRNGTILRHTTITFLEIMLGMVIGCLVGTLIGFVISRSKLLEAVLLPYLVVSQVIPKTAMAPLFILWFGFGITSKIVIVSLMAFFPMLVNTLVGIRSVEPDKHRLMRLMSATRWQTLAMLELPFALPHLFAGLKISVNLAVVGAVVAEFIEAQAGLGYLILVANGLFDTELVFAVLLVLSALGIAMYGAVVAVERYALYWHESTQMPMAGG